MDKMQNSQLDLMTGPTMPITFVGVIRMVIQHVIRLYCDLIHMIADKRMGNDWAWQPNHMRVSRRILPRKANNLS